MTRLARATAIAQWVVGVAAATAIVLLFSLDGASEPATTGAETATDAEFAALLDAGGAIYEQRCASCHGNEGQGGQGPRLAGTVAVNLPDASEQFDIIANGQEAMPAFGDDLDDDEIAAVVAFTRFGWG